MPFNSRVCLQEVNSDRFSGFKMDYRQFMTQLWGLIVEDCYSQNNHSVNSLETCWFLNWLISVYNTEYSNLKNFYYFRCYSDSIKQTTTPKLIEGSPQRSTDETLPSKYHNEHRIQKHISWFYTILYENQRWKRSFLSRGIHIHSYSRSRNVHRTSHVQTATTWAALNRWKTARTLIIAR